MFVTCVMPLRVSESGSNMLLFHVFWLDVQVFSVEVSLAAVSVIAYTSVDEQCIETSLRNLVILVSLHICILSAGYNSK